MTLDTTAIRAALHSPRSEGTIAQLCNEVDRLRAEVAELVRENDLAKWHCGCALDKPTDVCAVHSPVVDALRESLRAELATWNDAEARMLASAIRALGEA